ncbi:MAG: LarC family nickel insertion protein, partial [Lachnospiraceae bacterium]|nr:LarC family nickel insertion protein [Lachnospiraceae bacterium]
SRPGILIHVMCHEKKREHIIQTIFKYTTSIGIRESRLHRYVLERRMETVETAYGPVRCKVSSGYGVERKKCEYEDLSRIAKETGLSLEKVNTDILNDISRQKK